MVLYACCAYSSLCIGIEQEQLAVGDPVSDGEQPGLHSIGGGTLEKSVGHAEASKCSVSTSEKRPPSQLRAGRTPKVLPPRRPQPWRRVVEEPERGPSTRGRLEKLRAGEAKQQGGREATLVKPSSWVAGPGGARQRGGGSGVPALY
jgi:hypothetical protein